MVVYSIIECIVFFLLCISEKLYTIQDGKYQAGPLEGFGRSGQVHPEDLENYLTKTNLDYMRNYFKSGKTSLSIAYKRKYNTVFKQVMMEIIPTNEYSDDNQSLYLYVKDIDI